MPKGPKRYLLNRDYSYVLRDKATNRFWTSNHSAPVTDHNEATSLSWDAAQEFLPIATGGTWEICRIITTAEIERIEK
jgi:hypothetical protein